MMKAQPDSKLPRTQHRVETKTPARRRAFLKRFIASRYYFQLYQTRMMMMTAAAIHQPELLLLAPAGSELSWLARLATSLSVIASTRACAFLPSIPIDCNWLATSARLITFMTIARWACALAAALTWSVDTIPA